MDHRRRRLRPWLVGLAAFGVVAGIGTWVIDRAKTRLPAPPAVLLAAVDSAPVIGVLHGSGSLLPAETPIVSQPLDGQVAQVRVKAGDVVKAGQVLARFDSLARRAELARAGARLVAAEAARFASEVLLSRLGGADGQRGDTDDDTSDARELAKAQLDTANAAVAAEEAAYRLATRQLRQHVVRAPTDGVVIARHIDPGQTVAAGGPLFELATELDRLRLVTRVPESQLAPMRVGLRAQFSVAASPGRTFTAVIASLGVLAGPDGGRYRPIALEVDNRDRQLAIGMTAAVTIPLTGSSPALRVPLAALAFTPRGLAAVPGEPAIWAGDTASLRRLPVEVGVSDGTYVEVRSPALAPGTAVAVAYAPAGGR